MEKKATITSKRQLTIPAQIYKQANLEGKRKVLISEKDGVITLVAMHDLVEALAGSLTLPKRWRGKASDEIVEESKEEYFAGKRTGSGSPRPARGRQARNDKER